MSGVQSNGLAWKSDKKIRLEVRNRKQTEAFSNHLSRKKFQLDMHCIRMHEKFLQHRHSEFSSIHPKYVTAKNKQQISNSENG
jgi:carotenoid cleavage dioxygenase-like enzyme